ncbi:MAG: DinB family protein [Acetobacteraceae bacterium]
MAAYNTEMNRRLYQASACIPDAEYTADRGAFWHSIHGTLVHLLWGDRIWMSRFDGWPRPDVTIQRSAEMIGDLAALSASRAEADAGIEDWAGRVTESWLGEELVWFSDASQTERRGQRGFLVGHFFNHQTHHRGQAHAMITACG